MEKLLYLAASALLALVPLSTSAEVRSQDVLHDARAWEPDVLVYRKMGVGTFALITARADFEECGVTKEQAGGVAVLFKSYDSRQLGCFIAISQEHTGQVFFQIKVDGGRQFLVPVTEFKKSTRSGPAMAIEPYLQLPEARMRSILEAVEKARRREVFFRSVADSLTQSQSEAVNNCLTSAKESFVPIRSQLATAESTFENLTASFIADTHDQVLESLLATPTPSQTDSLHVLQDVSASAEKLSMQAGQALESCLRAAYPQLP